MNGPAPVIPPHWQWHHRRLLEIRAALRREHDEHAAAARTPHEPATDAVDKASAETERDTLFAELSHEEAELADVEHALERLRDGSYGLCEATGRPISSARLRALPWTRFSHEAAQRREDRASRDGGSRP